MATTSTCIACGGPRGDGRCPVCDPRPTSADREAGCICLDARRGVPFAESGWRPTPGCPVHLPVRPDEALLAQVMRKFLSDDHGWVDYAGADERFQGPAWIRIAWRIALTDEEYAAVKRAGQP